MGDIVEITTGVSSLAYKISSNGIIFYVKSDGNSAMIDLTKNLAVGYICRVDIGPGNIRIFINNNTPQTTNHNNEDLITEEINLLPNTEYAKYWLSWEHGVISVGKGDDPTPLLSRKDVELRNIKYLKFFSDGGQVHWKIILPPIRKRRPLIEISRGELQWVEADDQLPDESIVGGYENEILYIVRSKHRGSLTPGKFVPSLGVGFIPWGGQANETTEFEVLCGFDCQWIPTQGDNIPVTAVHAGFSEDYLGEVLYVGRASHEGHIIPGKVQPSHKVCYIPFDGREIAKHNYEILVSPFVNKHTASEYYLQCHDALM